MNHLKQSLLVALGTAALTVAPALPAHGQQQQQQAPQQQQSSQQQTLPKQPQQSNPANLQKIQVELQQLTAQLATLQEKASEKKPVQKTLTKLEKRASKKMVEVAPELEEEVERLHELRDELRGNEQLQQDAGQRDEEFQDNLEEYQKLNQQLMPVQQQVYQAPEIAELRAEYYEKLLNTMTEIDPKAEDLLNRRNALVAQLQQHQQQQQHQPQPQQQQPQQR